MVSRLWLFTLIYWIAIEHLIKAAPFKILCVQTDNGAEFTKRLLPGDNGPSLFETRFEQADIRHKLIRPYTPRHNGKVERSHRKDNEYFYADHKFYSFEDFKGQLKIHRYKYNRFPIRPLGWLSPNEYLAKYRNNTSASSV